MAKAKVEVATVATVETVVPATVPADRPEFLTVRVPRILNVPLTKDQGFVTVELDRIPEDFRDGLIVRAALSGLAERFKDAGAGRTDEMKARASAIRDRLYEGQWTLISGRSARSALDTEIIRLLILSAVSVGLDPKGMVKGTIREGVIRVIVAAARKASKEFSLTDIDAIARRNVAAIEAAAKSNIASRVTPEIDFTM